MYRVWGVNKPEERLAQSEPPRVVSKRPNDRGGGEAGDGTLRTQERWKHQNEGPDILIELGHKNYWIALAKMRDV